MSARTDAARIAALVEVVDDFMRGEPKTLSSLAEQIFGWSPVRVFAAIDAALAAKLIAKNPKTGQVSK